MVEQADYGRPRRRGPSIVGPLILIALGVVFLLNTLEMLPWDVWESLWRLWPLVLVLIGLEILLGRGNPWLGAFIGFIVVGVAGTLIFISGVFGPAYRLGGPIFITGPQAQQVLSPINVPLEGAREASVTVKYGAGRLVVGALGSDTGSLLEGSVSHLASREFALPNVSRQGERVDVTIQGTEGGMVVVPRPMLDTLQLALNTGLPISLRLQGGAADADLDLRSLRIHDLYVEMGASTMKVKLPEAAGTTTASFKTGMFTLSIDVPSKVAARITSRGGLSTLKVDERRFPKQGSYYISPGYETALNKVEIDIDAGMASVTVQ